jgi:hypothetical protein
MKEVKAMNKRRLRTQGKTKHLSNYKQFTKDKILVNGKWINKD